MSTFFVGEGNIGSAPEFQVFPSGNDEPRRLLRLNVYFDNPVPREGSYEDRGGYWAPVELWHREAEHWSMLYQKGMRVLVEGRTVRDEWEDSEDNARVTFKIEARRVGILPHRVHNVVMRERPSEPATSTKQVEQSAERASSQSSSATSKPRKRKE
ncbi:MULTISPECIES: single-stranded DNA-binding protein [Pseudomonas]|uniref:Single-stranded DNA-binding protein n=1 Tax=Pseudomonas lactis TaxID=1615674 RepID=A0A921NR72_9PSED|nr:MULTISPECIES: single-stranded DNA-binding protein [Pseudomonas]QBQ10312.1 single-stranded DNA-binding protein [Pseudomonas sp. SXM-1]HJH22692.1 single-stranded DNA-binding protein [Pseudomonas lactis]